MPAIYTYLLQVGTYAIHQAMATAFSLFYCLAHARGWFPQYRIQKDAEMDVPLLKVKPGRQTGCSVANSCVHMHTCRDPYQRHAQLWL